jgi:hypothetical protein
MHTKTPLIFGTTTEKYQAFSKILFPPGIMIDEALPPPFFQSSV